MKATFRTLLVASAVAATAASLGAIGIDAQQAGQAQQSQSSQSSQSGQSTQSTEPTQSPQQSGQPGAQGRDEAAARQELVQAKQALLDMTKLPEAAQLQGEARNGVIQIINAFNSLVTADANWYDRYQEVQQQLARVLGNDVNDTSAASSSSTSGAEAGSTGTSGTTTAAMPAPIRNKLVEFRQHLTAFGKAAGAPGNGAPAGAGSTAASSGQSSTSTTSGQGGTGTTSATSPQSGAVASAAGETFQQHFDAIADLVQQALGNSPASDTSTTTGTSGTSGSTPTSGSASGTGATGGQTGTSSATSSAGTVNVDRATLEQIQSHLQRLRQLARDRGIQ